MIFYHNRYQARKISKKKYKKYCKITNGPK